MIWNPVITKAPDGGMKAWPNNGAMYAEYDAHLVSGYAENTQRNYREVAKVYLRMLGDTPAVAANPADIQNFVEAISPKCPHLQNGKNSLCRLGRDINTCPLSRQRPWTDCDDYRPLDVVQVWHYLCGVNALYKWMIEVQAIAVNPVLRPLRQFRRRHRGLFDERRRKARRRPFKRDDVVKLVLYTPIWIAMPILLMAKCFLRAHELRKLSLAPEYCNLEESWMDIPFRPHEPGKRKGNCRIVIDDELMPWMQRYLLWRSSHIKPDAKGQLTDRLLLNSFGQAWGKCFVGNFRIALHKHAVRLGLMTGEEKRKEERLGPHGLRAFATTMARKRKAPDAALQVMRGDLAPGSIDRYDLYLDRLPDVYRDFGPRLDFPLHATHVDGDVDTHSRPEAQPFEELPPDADEKLAVGPDFGDGVELDAAEDHDGDDD